jgi:hypothetical protein
MHTALTSPVHPYDYRKDNCPETPASLESQVMGCVVKKLSQLEASCYLETDPTKTRQCRDEVVGATKKLIDDDFRRFVSNFFGRNAALMTSAETSVTALGAAAAITTPPSAASVLAAVSATINTLSTSGQKNFLADHAADLILGQMEADRSLVDKRIRLGLMSETKDYPLAVAMSDLADYALTMSVPHALQSLREAGSAPAAAAKQALADRVSKQLDAKLQAQ